MKLLYLWVKKYKNLENLEFYFLPNHRIFKNEKENTISLRIEKKDNDFFRLFDSNIDYTAIVGENGTGKSNLLEIICEYSNIGKYSDIFTIFIDKEKYYYFHNNEKIKINPYTPDTADENYILKKDIKKLNSISNETILYTEVPSKHIFETKTISNISFWNKVQIKQQEFIKKFIVENFDEDHHLYYSNNFNLKNLDEENFNDILLNKSIEIIKNSLQLKQLKLKKHLKFSPDIGKEESELEFTFDHENFNEIDPVDVKKVTKIVLYTIISNFKFNDEDSGLILEFIEELDNILYISVEEEGNWSYNTVIDLIQNEAYIPIFKSKDLTNIVDEVKKFETEYKSLINKLNKDINFTTSIYKNKAVLSINLEVCSIKLIEQLELFNTYLTFPIFSITWKFELSAGEESFLYLFASLYEKLIEKNLNEKKSITIVIDEIEAFLHPNWQKLFIDSINTFLNLELFKKFDFHIILTTHSPFLLSDLTDGNIIYLQKDKNNLSKNVSNEITIDTFAGNIHELLTHSFFMDGKTQIGLFSKNKIEKVIQLISHTDDLSEQDHKFCIKTISIIGEPVLQKRLLSMYNDKLKRISTKNTDVLKEIATFFKKEIGFE